ncbi:phage antirepressor KilAC domain-containing protein [Kingella negevensis]|uniref:phage antirepressor KilAC domain-containing protein n=1 Tax=Kingella negevensis TaxID=1522312 RepID=UPI00050A325E|nr:phage antirepressor KilAC domain-containing protein [Kingella negevensis]MDK4688520.1 phage antirepressor KilAC domain-containing protein [Kingella negevensis]
MTELFTLVNRPVAGQTVRTVNARELHAFLGNKMHFADWIKKRIADYGFVENVDYVRVELAAGLAMVQTGGNFADILHSQKNETQETSTCDFGQRGRIEYALSLDMAKELSMVERNAKGKQARQYFIECEKQLSGSLKPTLPQNYKEALLDLVAQVEANEKLQQQITANAPKVAFADAVGNSDDVILIRDLAKLLKQNGVEIGERRLFVWLRENGYLTLDNKATQRSMNLGVFRMTQSMISTSQGNQLRLTTKVTGKGQQYFLNRFKTGKAA